MSVPCIEPLPEGWEMRLDDTTKTYYFINHNDRSTQWHHPVSRLVYRPQLGSVPSANGHMGKRITIERAPVVTNVSERVNPRLENVFKSTVIEPYAEFPPIHAVMTKAKSLTEEVNRFQGSPGDREYVRLMESLELLILELDGIGIDGQEDLRNARRSAVRELQQVLEMLEFRGSMSGDSESPSHNTPTSSCRRRRNNEC
uniref:BAG family molecular chaperone regulator 3 n=1 Tax=Schistocephalus solidus TaxID=70667 RepID=A0A0X3PEQ6_SCHSO